MSLKSARQALTATRGVSLTRATCTNAQFPRRPRLNQIEIDQAANFSRVETKEEVLNLGVAVNRSFTHEPLLDVTVQANRKIEITLDELEPLARTDRGERA